MKRVLIVAACMMAALPAPAAAVSFLRSSMQSSAIWQFSSGATNITLSSDGDSSAYQQLSDLEIGRTYRLTFDLSAESLGTLRTARLTTTTTGAQVTDHLFEVGGLAGEIVNGSFVTTFRALRTTHNFQFINRESDGFSLFLSNVQASLVPEPAAWAMMLAGFGLTGFAMRRRKTPFVTA